MREIKFRAWDKGHKGKVAYTGSSDGTANFIEVHIPPHMEHVFNPVAHGEINVFDFSWLDQDRYVLMQYTGLKDKHGIEIYEGDILLVPDVYTDIIVDGQGPSEEDNHLAPVVFQDGSFGCDIKDNGDYYKKGFVSFPMMEYEMAALFNNELEIIGNIYENPELLESK